MPNVAPERRRATMTVCWHRYLRTGTVHAIDPGDCGVFINHKKRLRSTHVRRIVMHDDVQLETSRRKSLITVFNPAQRFNFEEIRIAHAKKKRFEPRVCSHVRRTTCAIM